MPIFCTVIEATRLPNAAACCCERPAARAQMKAHWAKIIFTGRGHPPEEAANSAEVKKLIVNNPNAIGYIDKSLVDATVKVLLSE